MTLENTLFKFVADTHWKGPKHLDIGPLSVNTESTGYTTLLLGDIVDRKNVKKRYLETAKSLIRKLKETYGEKYILGNHECEKPEDYYYKIGDLLACHGHTLFWSDERIGKYEMMKGGIGFLKWKFLTIVLKLEEKFYRRVLKPTIELEDKCYEIMKTRDCHKIVFGHTHTKKLVVHSFYRDGEKYTLINVPRGITNLNLNI